MRRSGVRPPSAPPSFCNLVPRSLIVNKDRLWKHLVVAFILAALLYAAGFAWIEHLRERQGPWQISFVHQPPSAPLVEINHERLGIHGVQVAFPDVQDLPRTNVTLAFGPGRPVPFDVPFGQCVFMDPTFLPGTVTLQVGPHKIAVFPRALAVDGRELQWQPGLHTETQPSALQPPQRP